MEAELEDGVMLAEMADEEGDEATLEEARDSLKAIKERAARAELEALLSGEADGNDAYLEVNSGAGGTESNDWAGMLLRMYMRWAKAHGYEVEIEAEEQGEQAGIKSATILISGPNAYGWLKSESGVHRLVRISPYDAAAKRHTSFASIGVSHRHLSRIGSGRAAHQQDGLGRSPDAHPDQYGRRLPGRTFPAPEP
jgi:peptide chain release factor 2